MSKYAGTWLRGALAVSASAAGTFQLQNTYGSNLIVTDVLIYITTAQTTGEARKLNVGAGSSNSTDYENLIDDVSLDATGVFSNVANAGTNGGIVVWKSNEYINASAQGGAPTGLVGFYAVHVIDISS